MIGSGEAAMTVLPFPFVPHIYIPPGCETFQDWTQRDTGKPLDLFRTKAENVLY